MSVPTKQTKEKEKTKMMTQSLDAAFAKAEQQQQTAPVQVPAEILEPVAAKKVRVRKTPAKPRAKAKAKAKVELPDIVREGVGVVELVLDETLPSGGRPSVVSPSDLQAEACGYEEAPFLILVRKIAAQIWAVVCAPHLLAQETIGGPALWAGSIIGSSVAVDTLLSPGLAYTANALILAVGLAYFRKVGAAAEGEEGYEEGYEEGFRDGHGAGWVGGVKEEGERE